MDAPLAIADFDGTLAHLDVDWPALKALLARTAELLDLAWDAGARLDENLGRIRHAGSEAQYRILCTQVARAEVQGFDPGRVNQPLVDLLAAREAPVSVFSANTHEALRQCLDHPCYQGIEPNIVGKEDVWNGKPDPEGLFRLCALSGVLPEEAVFIGDAPQDREAAAAAGMTFIEAPPFAGRPAQVVDHRAQRPSMPLPPKQPSPSDAGERR
jgi:phosphoglycolate phosphatase-like HAD superfamily hydrolase